MIPKGPLFFNLRTRLLNLYPENANVVFRSRNTCVDWLKSGTYTVYGVDKYNFTIEANKVDFASVLLSEVENLLNHCVEHIKELILNLDVGNERSDAWQVVTIYYYGYFAAQCFLRLIGRPIIFLDKAAVNLVGATSNLNIIPNRGNYIINTVSDLSATSSQYGFKRLDKSNHEAVWVEFFKVIEELSKTAIINPDASEIAFFKDLISSGLKSVYKSNEWPAVIRAMANYRPGFAYRAVLKDNRALTHRLLLDDWRGVDQSTIITILDRTMTLCLHGNIDDYHAHVRYLHSISHSIYLLARELYFELYNRRRIVDRRWEDHRKTFRNSLLRSSPDFALLLS
jgi:hypothetical protein